MTFLDRWIQTYRIEVVRPQIPAGAKVLDIGCADGKIFKQIRSIQGGIGIDPFINGDLVEDRFTLIKGSFPEDLDPDVRFDVITMLAVLEHIPQTAQSALVDGCARHLKSGGRVVITVPSATVDYILAVLKFLHLIDGMSLEQHYGFDVNQVPVVFQAGGFLLERRKKFQLGLNNLFVLTKP